MTKNMIKRTSLGVALGWLGLVAGCDSASLNSTDPYCSAKDGSLCAPAGFSYVTQIRERTDACPGGVNERCTAPLSKTTAVVTSPEPGKACMKGTVAGRDGFAWLILQVSQWAEAPFHVVDVLDAKALGITEIRFNVENASAADLTMFATSVHDRYCPMGPGYCMNGFDFRTGPRSSKTTVMNESGPVSAPFTDFSNDDPNMMLDTSQMGHFIFVVGAGDYDFCVSGVKFVDASGNEIGGSMTAADAGAPEAGATDAGASEGG